jgi:hypothetical protein
MQQNELKEKSLKISALEALQDTRMAAAAPAASHLNEELVSKVSEIGQLKKALQESQHQLATIKQLQEQQEFQIPWNAAKLGSTARDYLSRLTSRGTKRKLSEQQHEPESAEGTKLNKPAIRNVMLTDGDLEKEMNSAMGQQQASLAKVQRNLLQAQQALRDAQEARDANFTRKRCLEARANVLQQQQAFVSKLHQELQQACGASEQAVQPLSEAVARLTDELAAKRAALIETQLTGSEMDLEKRIRADAHG